MYKFIKSDKDATLYQLTPSQNTGRDQILEIGKYFTAGGLELSRIIIKFDDNKFPFSQTGSYYEVDLVLKETESTELRLDYEIEGRLLIEDWEMGDGSKFVNQSSVGVSWLYTDGEELEEWQIPGGTFDTGSITSQSFSYESTDIEMDVKPLVDEILSGSITNHGFLLKHIDFAEDDERDYGLLKFYSKETNTIYEPRLRFKWDDSDYDSEAAESGSLVEIEGRDIKVLVDVKSQYVVDTTNRIFVRSRELYPPRTFEDRFQYNTDNFLPEETYYRIVDISSTDIIIPFSDFSKVSLNEFGNYFDVDFTDWEIDRDYEIEIKTIRNGEIQVFKDKFIFTLVD